MTDIKTFEVKYEFSPSKDNALRLQRAYELIFEKSINNLLKNQPRRLEKIRKNYDLQNT